jgi:hypothetical protein
MKANTLCPKPRFVDCWRPCTIWVPLKGVKSFRGEEFGRAGAGWDLARRLVSGGNACICAFLLRSASWVSPLKGVPTTVHSRWTCILPTDLSRRPSVGEAGKRGCNGVTSVYSPAFSVVVGRWQPT